MLAVANVLGMMIAFFGVTYVLPIACSMIYDDGMIPNFVAAAIITVGAGLAIAGATRHHKRELKPRDGFLLVTLSWILISGSACVPFLIALPGISFTDAFFEAASGLTTTGATVLTNLADLPPSINFWRHALHWFGGIGIIVLAVAVMPLLGVGGMQLYRAETPGPVKDEKLTPRITETAKALWITYAGLTLVCALALHLAGMEWFDAICHAFTAISIGGFSTHDASIAYYDSVAIELVLMVSVTLAAMNFARHFVAIRRLTLTPYRKDPEVRALLLVLALSVLGVATLLTVNGTYGSFLTSLRHAAFNVVSIGTTTGLVSQDYELWPAFAQIWMLFLSGIACSTGSTGGGIKMFRTLLLARQAAREMKLLVHPSAVIPIRIGGQVVPDRIAYSVLAFIFLYFQTIAILTFVLLLSGMEFLPALSTIVACINNMGPGIGPTGPSSTFQVLSDFQTWVCTLAMFLGRLEIFGVLILFTAAFWRK